jgi:hypothetical protein
LFVYVKFFVDNSHFLFIGNAEPEGSGVERGFRLLEAKGGSESVLGKDDTNFA